MRKSAIVIFCLGLLCCKKEEAASIHALKRTDFFASENAALQTIQLALDERQESDGAREIAERIESVSYIDTRAKSLAVVFYHSNLGLKNMVITRDLLHPNQLPSTTKCEGEECTCKVSTIIADNGDVTMTCSCKSCSMITTGAAESAPATE